MLTARNIKVLIESGEGYNAEFKVQLPKKLKELVEEVCAFSNAAGGYLFLGVDNRNTIKGIEIDNTRRSAVQNAIREILPAPQTDMYPVKVDDKTVWVIEVFAGNNKPYLLSGAIYIREGANTQKLIAPEEIRAFFQESGRIYFDEVLCHNFTSEQIDEENFEYFCSESKINRTIPNEQILLNLQVRGDQGAIKNGGVLFFAHQPENYFYQAIIRCVMFKGTEKVLIIDDKTFGGPLYRQYKQAFAWLQSKMQVAYEIKDGGPRKEIWEIPLNVFREAIINALSHRDYYEKGAVTMVEVFDDRVEISNPGGLLPSVEQSFGTKSVSRNPLVFGLFARMQLVEKVASGIPRMREEMREAGLPDPLFATEGFFTITFLRRQKQVTGTSQGTEEYELRGTQRRIVEMMRKNGKITITEMVESLDISEKTINKHIAVLKRSGIISREGGRKDGIWIVPDVTTGGEERGDWG